MGVGCLPGQLVEGTPYEWSPDVYHQAGQLLAEFHQQYAVPDAGYESRENERTLLYLIKPHRIAPDVADAIRATIQGWPTPPATLVSTHGAWQPRNWLVDNGAVRVIDFGRADLRPAYTDFARLAAGAPDDRRNLVVSARSPLASSPHVQPTVARSAHP